MCKCNVQFLNTVTKSRTICY